MFDSEKLHFLVFGSVPIFFSLKTKIAKRVYLIFFIFLFQ